MATKRMSSSTDATSSPGGTYQLFADLPRRQLAMMTSCAGVLYRGSEAVRAIQHEAAQRAGARHEEAAQRLRAGCEPSELMAIQAELVRSSLQEATQYWQQIMGAALRLQAEMVSNAGAAALDAGGEPSLSTLQKVFEASLNGQAAGPTTH